MKLLLGRVRIHVIGQQCPLFPKMYFKPLKKEVGAPVGPSLSESFPTLF